SFTMGRRSNPTTRTKTTLGEKRLTSFDTLPVQASRVSLRLTALHDILVKMLPATQAHAAHQVGSDALGNAVVLPSVGRRIAIRERLEQVIVEIFGLPRLDLAHLIATKERTDK